MAREGDRDSTYEPFVFSWQSVSDVLLFSEYAPNRFLLGSSELWLG